MTLFLWEPVTHRAPAGGQRDREDSRFVAKSMRGNAVTAENRRLQHAQEQRESSTGRPGEVQVHGWVGWR